MSLPAGTTVKNGFALTPDGALYVTATGTASITGGVADDLSQLSVSNGTTGSTNYERIQLKYVTNEAQIYSVAGGTGTQRALSVGGIGGSIRFNGSGIDFNNNTNSTGFWRINTSGNFIAITDNTYDIGASSATRPRNLYLASSIKQVGGITTSGVVGTPAIVATGRATAQVGANASVSTFTVGAADASFEVSANVLVTTATTHSFSVTCAYTDEGNTARVLTLNFTNLTGTFSTLIVNTGGAVPYESPVFHIRCKAATAITIATSGTFTSVVYNVEGIIKQTA